MSNSDIFQKNTKIVATIGPASDTEELLSNMITAGMNVARFNTKHNVPEWHQERIRRVKKVAQEMGVSVGTLLDLQGPEIRINIPGNGSFMVDVNDVVMFAADGSEQIEDNVVLIPDTVIAALSIGDRILIDDGIGEFQITEKQSDHVIATALGNFEVKDRKTLNTPGVELEALPSLIEKDYAQLDGATNDVLDYVALSFVRNAQDIAILRDELDKRSLNAKIVAKIENQSAIDNLDSIIAASDAVMVARGDLAVEVPYQELTHWQKTIIEKSRALNKPVITATQMLKSMVDNPRPTRAEVSDVAHAVYDGTDAVMLSEETTIGKYAVKAVHTQATICQFNEQYAEVNPVSSHNTDIEGVITETAIELLDNVGENESTRISKIVCLTETGRTARLLSRFRPIVPIFAICGTVEAYYSLSLSYGVTPISVDIKHIDITNEDQIVQLLKSKQVVSEGERVLVIHGPIWKEAGKTNQLALVDV